MNETLKTFRVTFIPSKAFDDYRPTQEFEYEFFVEADDEDDAYAKAAADLQVTIGWDAAGNFDVNNISDATET